ncbi:carbohydrate ABC transporter substrate-binding protein, CUT1 family [Alkalispirochaeta americana]|uniref:Carbohydrate ABC transporter substrate-binding protein, CUT1 family n=1 Tax=Alkalispirochaeta americana TaxID=159291 RepID=A0A1N6Q9C1_9SPIO|nr:extracellular solute-binding protein [Alkalispirochaeta americana]SIQ13201.1 carbohydrate ABC transporter substrate-binding protein, CUT1 family [Alkalispirochaeta americana]
MRIIRTGIAVVMVSLFFCGVSGDVRAGGTGERKGGRQEIRVQTRWASDAPHEAAFQQLLRDFDDLHENVRVVDESVGNEISFNDRLRTAIATGNTPDVVYTLGGAAFRQYAENGVYLNLEPFLTEDPEWQDFFLPLFENWQFQDLEGVYGVPYESYGVGIFYNRQIFRDLGLEPPRTVEDFEIVAEALMEKGIVPMAIGNHAIWRGGHLFTNLMLKRHGAEIAHGLADRSIRWDGPEVLEVLDLIDNWHRRGFFGDNVVTASHNEEVALFHGGDTAMHMDGSWYIGSANASPLAEHIGFIPFPSFADYPQHRRVWMGGAAGGLSLSGTMSPERQEIVISLLKFLTSPEAFATIQEAVGGGVYPVRLEVDSDAVDRLTAEHAQALADAQALRTDLDSYDSLPQMTDRLRNSIQGMFAGQTPREAAREIQQEVDRGGR